MSDSIINLDRIRDAARDQAEYTRLQTEKIIELEKMLRSIKSILRDFALGPITISSVNKIIALAELLDPSIRQQRTIDTVIADLPAHLLTKVQQ